VIGVALACWGGGSLALLAPFVSASNNNWPLIWPPTGIAVAAVWRFGKPALLGTALAAAISAWLVSGSLAFCLLLGLAGVLPPAFVNWQLRRSGVDDIFGDPRAVLRFSVIAGLMAPTFSATLGVFTLWSLGRLPTSAGLSWLLWWGCEAIAILLITPAVLSTSGWRELDRRRRLELSALVVATLAFWWVLFFDNPNPPLALTILTMPLMIGLSLRFNFSAVASFSLLLAIISIFTTSKNPALYAGEDPYSNLLFMHLFLAVLACSSLVIAAGSAAMRRAFRQTRTNEERFRAVFEQAAVGFMVRDLNSNVRLVNEKLCKQLGYEASEFPELHWDGITHPDDVEFSHAQIEPVKNGVVDSATFEKRYIRKDGSLMWADLTISLARTDGQLSQSIVVINDISQRKRAEAQLQGQTRILQLLAAGAPLAQLLDELALFAEELWPRMRCAIYLTDLKAKSLRFGAAPNFPFDLEHQMLDIPIVDHVGIGCTSLAAARNQTIIAADTLLDPLWKDIRFVVERRAWQRACWATPFADMAGTMLGVITLYFDRPCAPAADDNELIRMLTSMAGLVVQRHDDARKLREREEMFRGIFEQAAVGVVLLDVAGDWLEINQLFCDIVGYTQQELQKIRYRQLLAPEGMAQALALREKLARGEIDNYQAERCYIRKDGARIWVDITASLVRDDRGAPERQIIVVQDISERKTAEAEIERLALYDYLTDLPNRRLFSDRLKHALASAHRSGQFGALLYVDLDNFKQLNDTHGHGAGDELLKMVAQRLQEHLREQDTVARLGGDEFIILLQQVGDSIATASGVTELIARKIQSVFDASFKLTRGLEHTVSASLGITLFPKGGETAEDLLKEADIAMYRVKTNQQRNAIQFYAPEMQVAADLRLALERDLRIALQREQFQLFLQPQSNAAGIIVGYEALLRWPHPEHGLIPPVTFIPIAEETGLIVALGEWVLKTAAQFIRNIDLAGEDLTIAVNVSPRQFREANFVERVRTLLWEAGADAGRLILEITEGTVVTDFDATSAKMDELKRLGIRLSIDDFGTGHSSLSYLKRLPIHELKIDRSFVTDLPDDVNDAALVDAILSVAHHLQLNVVAEGVETAAQLTFLIERGCEQFQGYHIGHPLPAASYLPFLETANDSVTYHD
jgi:diguanylate cyclase (GGDEF)-like protein/PAS domain S-box-containing protein